MKSLVLTATTLLSFQQASATSSFELRTEIESTYNPQIEIVSVSRDWSFYGCAIQNIEIIGQDPVSFEKRKVAVSIYQARKNPGQAVILLPPTGGVNILDRGYANELCSSGMTVALVSGWDHQNETSLDIQMHNRGAFRALSATRHVVEYLSQRNIRKIGLLGTSIGAITGALALGYEPRIGAAALIVGSARFADVVAETTEKGGARLRSERMKAQGYKNIEEYRQAVKSVIRLEPADFIEDARDKTTMLITADADITVPTAYQLELLNTLKPQVHLHLRGNHFDVIKSSFFRHRRDVVTFFKAYFEQKN